MTKQTELLVLQEINTVGGLLDQTSRDCDQFLGAIFEAFGKDMNEETWKALHFDIIGRFDNCVLRLKHVRYAIAKDVGANLDLGGICFEGLEELMKEEETNESAN